MGTRGVVRENTSQLVGVAVMALLMLCAPAAQAVPVVFDFEGLAPTGASNVVGSYMTGVYGSTVRAEDVDVWSNSSAPSGVPWTGNGTQWLTNNTSSGSSQDLEILFASVPIWRLLGTTRGYVFLATTPGADLTIKAYDSSYSASGGSVEDPNAGALVFQQSFDVASGTEVDIPDIVFSRAVSLLVFGGYGPEFAVGIDDLAVDSAVATPEPGTLLLLGSGLAGLGAWRFCARQRRERARRVLGRVRLKPPAL